MSSFDFMVSTQSRICVYHEERERERERAKESEKELDGNWFSMKNAFIDKTEIQ